MGTADRRLESDQAVHPSQPQPSEYGDRGAYLATIAGGLLWAAFLALAVAIGPQAGGATGTPYFGYLILFSVLAWLASIVTMYVDLRSMERRLWGTRPAAWIIGAILLYVVVLPIYVYKRHVSVAPDS